MTAQRDDAAPDCTRTASCEPDDHTYSWPCDYAPLDSDCTDECPEDCWADHKGEM